MKKLLRKEKIELGMQKRHIGKLERKLQVNF